MHNRVSVVCPLETTNVEGFAGTRSVIKVTAPQIVSILYYQSGFH